ncbi:NUDIX hydrolase [Candidatus Saccharibacteria bacterium]|nr:NUDIX hydrolase [Candidatus Saccharibacteria bacterium]
MRRLHRFLGRLAARTIPIQRFDRRRRVRVAVLDHESHILLVQNWFGQQLWSLPGGACKRNETPAAAAIRELREETGIVAPVDALQHIGRFSCDEGSRPFVVDLFTVRLEHRLVASSRSPELLTCDWHDTGTLPSPRSTLIGQALQTPSLPHH